MTGPVNFSKLLQRRQNLRSSLILLVLFLLIIWLASQYGQSQSISKSNEGQHTTTVKSKQRVLTAEEQQQNAAATELVGLLNIPWLSMLTDLESVLAAVPNIYLTQLQPNSRAGQIMISGEADTLKPLLDLMQQLESQSAFNDVLLMQQKQLEDDPTRLGFTVKIGWQ